jgi:hypothetical protein
MLADVYLAGQVASSLPIQVIDASYSGGAPYQCGTSEANPSATGFNGILGVGLLSNDCPDCVSSSLYNQYWSCNGTSCSSSISIAANKQVTNPVSALNSPYNNGTILTVGAVNSSAGASNVTGTMTLGIGSTPATIYSANASINFTSYYGGGSCGSSSTLTGSFVDSGSNFWDFPNSTGFPSIGVCSNGLFCPASPTTINVWPGSCSNPVVSFSLIKADSVVNNGFTAYNNVGAPFNASPAAFDFGFPFFYGRSIYNCINGKTCGGNSGPFWSW